MVNSMVVDRFVGSGAIKGHRRQRRHIIFSVRSGFGVLTRFTVVIARSFGAGDVSSIKKTSALPLPSWSSFFTGALQGVAMRIEFIAIQPSMSFGMAMEAFAGQNGTCLRSFLINVRNILKTQIAEKYLFPSDFFLRDPIDFSLS